MMRKFSDNGQLLVEVVVGLGVILVALVGIVIAASQAVKTSGVANRRYQANYLAEKILEEVKREKEADPAGFFTKSDLLTENCGPVEQNNVSFECGKFYDFSDSNDQVLVVVNISWDEGEGSSTASVSSTLVKIKI
ncbi:hypothetical protein HY333_00665 [Candidatus Collierbacteria bacterium]|nr:hypothetical protein [Candidatus Collierbacteria bacterium]